MVMEHWLGVTWRYVMSGSCFMTVFLDTQLLVTIRCLKWAQASSQTQWKRHWLWLCWFFGSRHLCSFHDIIPYFMFSISSPTFGLLYESSLYTLIDFPIERQTLGVARRRQGALFPFVQYNDDLTSSCMPTFALVFLLDFISWKAAVNYKSIF